MVENNEVKEKIKPIELDNCGQFKALLWNNGNGRKSYSITKEYFNKEGSRVVKPLPIRNIDEANSALQVINAIIEHLDDKA